MSVPFNRPPLSGHELRHLTALIEDARCFSGNGKYGRQCEQLLQEQLCAERVLLTPSCTAALEMAAILSEVGPGDEVILPSYTFVTTASSFALRGATLVFVDVCPQTMNIDPQAVRAAITERTRVLVPVHYAGVSCNMDELGHIAAEHDLLIVEDAAQGALASYKGRPLGSMGSLGCLSFHETKNLSCGEGGALIINDPKLIKRAEIIRDKGTNRAQYFRGQVDKYTWQDIGSSYLLSEFQAAVLLGQLDEGKDICSQRLELWHNYYNVLEPLSRRYGLELPHVPDDCQANGHLFYFKTPQADQQDQILALLRKAGVGATFHYVPLHSSPAGQRFGRFHGPDRYTTADSQRLVRLPLFYGMTAEEQGFVLDCVRRAIENAVPRPATEST